MNILIVHETQRNFYRHPCGGNRHRSYDKACHSSMSLCHVKEIAGLLLRLSFQWKELPDATLELSPLTEATFGS